MNGEGDMQKLKEDQEKLININNMQNMLKEVLNNKKINSN